MTYASWSERCWKRGSNDWTVCCSLCLALSYSNLASLSSAVSAASLSFAGVPFSDSFSCQSFSLTLKGTHLQQFDVYFRGTLSCWPFGVWEGHWSAAICFCSFVSAGFGCSLLSSAVWVSREAGSLPPSVFSQSTQLLAVAYRHTVVGIHAPTACSDVAANTTAVPCTVKVHTLWLSFLAILYMHHRSSSL